MIDAYVTNLGRYVEGHLDGEYLKLPATKEDVQALLGRIGVDGVMYEETFITDYELEIPALYDCLGEYESIDELNYLATLLEDMSESDLAVFEAALDLESYSSIKELINLTENLDCYDYLPGVDNEYDLGWYYLEECSALDIPEHLRSYIDYEAYGRDVHLSDGGCFAEGGYVISTGDSMIEHYSGDREDIPEEYRIFAYPEPEPSIREALNQYRQKIAEAPSAIRDKPVPAHEAR